VGDDYWGHLSFQLALTTTNLADNSAENATFALVSDTFNHNGSRARRL